MLSVHPSPGNAAYYEGQENYYDQGSLGEPVWFGKAAEALGLTGSVDEKEFDRLSDGRLPEGTVLGRGLGDKREHLPGWDLTFSAPKSVSIMAMVHGDKRLVEAVSQAAKDAMTWVEGTAAKSRFKEGDTVKARLTGNLAVAMFLHDLTRANEPGIHVHAIVMNATQGPDGSWRSLDSQFLYWIAKEAGLRFQQSLALLVRQLGYEVVANPKQGTFEIAGVPREAITAFSSRSGQIEEKLADMGLTRETAPTTTRKAVAAATRGPKDKDPDRVQLARGWRQLLDRLGIDLSAIGLGGSQASSTPPPGGDPAADMADDALKATRDAARALAERHPVFSQNQLVDRAARYAIGRADRPAIRQAVERLEREDFLHARELAQHDRVAGAFIRAQGWTTAEVIDVEKEIDAAAVNGKQAVKPILGYITATRFVEGQGQGAPGWTEQHENALWSMLTRGDRILSVDGAIDHHADRQWVQSYLRAASDHGLAVHVMAPAASGAAALGHLLNRPVQTVSEHLGAQWQANRQTRTAPQPWLGPGFPRPTPAPASRPDQVWLVGDASQLRPSAARDLFQSAERNNARVVLLDTVRQFVPGSPLDQLEQAGVRRIELPEAPERDRNQMHLAVAALQRGEPALALEHIEKAGGNVVSIGAASRSFDDQRQALEDRRAYIADTYAALDPAERETTRPLELTQNGKEALSAAIRERLIDKGELSGPTLTASILTPKSLTKTERQQSVSYEPGDVIRFGSPHRRAAGRPAIAAGNYLVVRDVDGPAGTVRLETERGTSFDWKPGQWGAARASAYRAGERDFAAGDRIVWTRTDKSLGLQSQQKDVIVAVDPETSTISVKRGGDIKTVELDKFKHVDHAYADIVRSGGRTGHIIAHMPADNVARTNLKTLAMAARQADRLTIVTENAARLAQAAEDRPGHAEVAGGSWKTVTGAALDAVRTAADILVERSSVFAQRDLAMEARRQGLGSANDTQLRAAVAALRDSGQLVRRESEVLDRETWSFVPAMGWTTLDALNDERKMLAAEERGRGAFADRPLMSYSSALLYVDGVAGRAPEHEAWNPEQRIAAKTLLSSTDRVTALQGLSGSAKTGTVLATVAKAAEEEGHEVTAMAPTTVAARHLGNELKTGEGKTLAQHLSDVSQVRSTPQAKSPLWIVDETAMASAKSVLQLIRAAEQHDARLFLVFDVLQLSSVGAGRAAGQLIEHGMRTAYLDRIVRQSGNRVMRDAVYDMIAQNPSRSLNNLIAAGGSVVEIKGEKEGEGRAQRHEAMAKDYLRRSPSEREATIVIDPTRVGVDQLTDRIRNGMKQKDELEGEGLVLDVMEDASLTERERSTPTSFRQDQIVRFARSTDLGNGRISYGSYLEVVKVEGAEVVLRDEQQRVHRWEPRARSLPVEVYDAREKELMVGDRIRWTRNVKSLGVVSGNLATVTAVDGARNRIQVEDKDKQRQTIDLTPRQHRHFTHGYAVTTQRAQGLTGRVIAHMPSFGVHTVHKASAVVIFGRTPDTASIFTDDRQKLIEGLEDRDGQKQAALDQVRENAGRSLAHVREMASARQAELNSEPVMETSSPTRAPERSIGRGQLER